MSLQNFDEHRAKSAKHSLHHIVGHSGLGFGAKQTANLIYREL